MAKVYAKWESNVNDHSSGIQIKKRDDEQYIDERRIRMANMQSNGSEQFSYAQWTLSICVVRWAYPFGVNVASVFGISVRG